ncbi:MAG TPA: sigma-E factor negative regulatory protein [Bordetella sp.]|uniref:sigma-E factor negative regulatory protein n=1 Tax=Bordetella sp. TaxID=28081 RepID=UPI002ED6100D
MQSAVSPSVSKDARDDALYIQISAWVDGEIEGDLPGILATPHGRQAWDTYHLIGDTLRSSDLALPAHAGFQARLLQALEAEPAIVAPSAPINTRRPLRMTLSGLAVAAAVAMVAWMIQPYLGSNSERSPALADAASAGPGNTATLDEASLHDYLEAHRQLAGPTAVRQVSFDVGTSR